MCKILNISRNTYYYNPKQVVNNNYLENLIISIFKESKSNYGSRKIKQELEKEGQKVSRKQIRSVMNKYCLVSNYTVKNYKPFSTHCNEEKIDNVIKREFSPGGNKTVAVSDLTYVNVNGKWNYICIILDLSNREIIGYSSGKHKNAELVKLAFSKIKHPLDKISIFHTDRGNEFKNELIDNLLSTFKIERSLSKKGCPYDNAVAEATFKIIKTEFVLSNVFNTLEILDLLLFDYVNWYNNKRIHGSLGYLSPAEFKIKVSE